MSDMKAFEIHTYQGGKWKIDSVFDDRDLALFEAHRMDQSGRYSGIRVVEEIYVEATQQTKTRTIYRGSKVVAENAAELRKSKQVRLNGGQARKKRQDETVERKKVAQKRKFQKKTSPVRLIAIMLVLVILVGGAIFGLQFVENLL
jgi:cobalamin biosynthesis Mg chelatase CobN